MNTRATWTDTISRYPMIPGNPLQRDVSSHPWKGPVWGIEVPSSSYETLSTVGNIDTWSRASGNPGPHGTRGPGDDVRMTRTHRSRGPWIESFPRTRSSHRTCDAENRAWSGGASKAFRATSWTVLPSFAARCAPWTGRVAWDRPGSWKRCGSRDALATASWDGNGTNVWNVGKLTVWNERPERWPSVHCHLDILCAFTLATARVNSKRILLAVLFV